MQERALIVSAAGIIIGVQVGLFAWLKADLAAVDERLTSRLDRVEREVAFMRGQLSLALPSLAQQEIPQNTKSN